MNLDEQYRADSLIERLRKLKKIYGAKAITTADSIGFNDRATTVHFMTREKAE